MARTSFTIGDKTYPFKLDLKAVRLAEDLSGLGVYDPASMQKYKFVMSVLWSGILEKDSQLTFAKLEKSIERACEKKQLSFAKVQRFVLKEIHESQVMSGFDDDDDEEESDADPLPPGES